MKKYIYPWSSKEISLLKRFKGPADIQLFLDKADYNKTNRTLTPSEVLRQNKAHCFDGAIFAASVFETLGIPPLLMDLRAVRDDDHVLAIYKVKDCFGAVAKSNYTGLRFREPIYKSLRELAVSYFDGYFNLQREKSLREYSDIFDLRKCGKLNWNDSQELFYDLAVKLDSIRHFPILSAYVAKKLQAVDVRSFRAGKLGRK